MKNDSELLRLYAEEKSNDAFAELVGRHLDFVFSAALREVRGDFARAQDIVQTVFTALARKASALHHRATLVGWLHVSVHHAAAELMRAEQRRQQREREAFTMAEQSTPSVPEDEWVKLRPVINEVVQELGEVDRDAVLLRFYQQRPFAEIADTLRLSTDAVQKRVERALEKMRAGLVRRGITSTAAALGVLLQNNGVVAAPLGLLGTVTQGALASAGASGGAAALFHFMTIAKIPLGIAAAVVVAASGAKIAVDHQAQAALRHEVATLRSENQQIAALRRENMQAQAELEALHAHQAENDRVLRELQASIAATAKSEGGNSGRAQVITMAQAQQWLAAANDPRVLARLVANGRALTLQRYSYLIDQLHLPPERSEALIKLLDDKRQVPMDIAVASFQIGIDPRDNPGDFQTRLAVERAGIEKKIRAFLGNEFYSQYLAYNQELNQESTFVRLGQITGGTEHALTSDQTAKLQQLLQIHRKASPAMLAEARGFLSEVQIDALEQVFRAKDAVKNRIPDELPATNP